MCLPGNVGLVPLISRPSYLHRNPGPLLAKIHTTDKDLRGKGAPPTWGVYRLTSYTTSPTFRATHRPLLSIY